MCFLEGHLFLGPLGSPAQYCQAVGYILGSCCVKCLSFR